MNDLAQRRKHLAETLMRDSICEAAETVLAEVGFASLTMDRVAQAADVSKGTLYNYFRDRDALVLDVVNRAFDPLHVELDELFATRTDIPGVLIESTRAILGYVERQHALGKVFCGGDLPPFLEARFRENHVQMLDRFTGVFEQAAAYGALRQPCGQPAMAARLYTMALHGVIEERILYPEECPPLSDELDFLTRFMINPWFKETE